MVCLTGGDRRDKQRKQNEDLNPANMLMLRNFIEAFQLALMLFLPLTEFLFHRVNPEDAKSLEQSKERGVA